MENIKKINITVLVIVASMILLTFITEYITLGNKSSVTMIQEGAALIPALIYVYVTKQNLFKLIRFNKIGALTIVLTVIFAIAIVPLTAVVSGISMLFVTNAIGDTAVSMVGNNLVVGLTMIAFIPTVIEETVCRGVIYNTYKGNNPLKAIILSSLIFGAIHMNFNQFVYATILGFIMAMLLEATNSIIAPMVMHFVLNGNSAISIYLLTKTGNLNQNMITKEMLIEDLKLSIPIAIVTTLIAVGIFVLIARRNKRLDYIKSIFKRKKDSEPDVEKKETKIFDIALVLAFVLCFAFAIWVEIGA